VLITAGRKQKQNPAVALDPWLHATKRDLAARLGWICSRDLNPLNKDINKVLAASDKLQKAVADHSVTDAPATAAVAALNRDIDSVAQMAMKASEGSLLFETKLRDHLAYLAADIDMSYDRPTAS
jgi:hypothetical protein